MEMELSILVIIYSSYMSYASCSSVQVYRWIKLEKKLFSISLRGKVAEWYKLLKNGRSIGWEEVVPLFSRKFYPPSEIHKDRNQIYNFWPKDGESTAQAWGRLKSLMLKYPILHLAQNIII